MKRFSILLVLLLLVLASCNRNIENEKITIIFKDYNDDIIETITMEELDEVIFPNNPERTGYSFVDWSLTKEKSDELIYIATYSPNEYRISFLDETIDDKYVNFDEVIGELYEPEKEGHIFEGWYYQDTLIDQSMIYQFDYSITVSAHWTTEKYKIEYYIDDEFTEFSFVHYNQQVEELLVPEKKHHQFIGWELEGEFISSPFVFKDTNNIELHAIFEPIIYTITFNDEFGYYETLTTKHGETTDNIPELINQDYDFLGWYLGNVKVTSPFIFNYDYDIELTARWEIKSYIIKFNENGGEPLNPQNVNKYEEIKSLQTPYKKDYVFLGWYLNDEKVEFPFKYDFNSDITLEAKWQIKEFDIFYNYENYEPTHTYANQKIEILPTPFNPNYRFLGWSLDDEILELPFIFDFNEDITLDPVFELKQYKFILNNNQTLDVNFESNFVYIINKTVKIPINIGELYYFDLEDEITIEYIDPNGETLEKISLKNNYYFNGLLMNEELILGIEDFDKRIFDLTKVYNHLDETTLTLDIKPVFEKLYDVEIVSLHQGNRISDASYLYDLDGNIHAKFKSIKDLELNILALEEKIDLYQTQYLFDYFTSESNTLIPKDNVNEATFIVKKGTNIIKAVYKIENVLVRILMTEQDDLYNNQPISFNGIVVNLDYNNFRNSDVIKKPVVETYLPSGEVSITLLTGRKKGIVESPGLFLLSKHYSELPESAILNGAFTRPVNNEERNRFYENNNKYINIIGENYSEVIFTIDSDKMDIIEIKLSFVPVYAVNENGLANNNEISSIADFGTMSEALNFENSNLSNKINVNSEFKQVTNFKAEHVFEGLGNQAVFVRPVATTLSNINYNGENHKIENANIFIGLQHDGGNFALFTDGIHKVSNLVVENITVVRGAEQNSTINNETFVRRFDFRNYNGRNEYKLKIGGVASGVQLLENITANNLNVNLNKITVQNQNGDLIESDVIAYVGGIAGVTGTLGVDDFGVSQNNILNSLFKGKISLTNTNAIVGGIAGLNISGISKSKSEATIVASGYVGGIAGENRGIISYSTFAGSVQGYGIVGGLVGLNNSIYYDSRFDIYSPPKNKVEGNILEGSVKLLGENENQFSIWHVENEKEVYNNYAGGFVGVSGLTAFELNYSNKNTLIEGPRVAPFIGLIDYKYPQTFNTISIKSNYFISTNNNVVNTNNNEIPALGYWTNINEINFDLNNLPFSNTIISINKTNTNVVFKNEYENIGLNKNNIMYNESQLTTSLFETFVNITKNHNARVQFNPTYEIADVNKYSELVAFQNTNYPYLTSGYENYYEVQDQVLISVSAFENGQLKVKGFNGINFGINVDNLSNWTIAPQGVSEWEIIPERFAGGNRVPGILIYVVKFTKIKIDITKDATDNSYFLNDYHRYYDYEYISWPYINPTNPQDINYNRNEHVGKDSFTLEYSNPYSSLNNEVVNDIKLHFVDKSTLQADVPEFTTLQNLNIYNESSFVNEHSQSYEQSFTLTSVNKSTFTNNVYIDVQTIESENATTINKESHYFTLNIKNQNEILLNSIAGLNLQVFKTINQDGLEVLEFNVSQSAGIYSITIRAEAYTRISASITGIDEHLSSTTISKVEFVAVYEAYYGGTIEVALNEVYNNQLLDTVLEVPLIHNQSFYELHSVRVVANNRHNHEPRFAMTPANISVNNNLVYENEFNFNANVNSANNYYQNETMNGFIEIENYLTEISQNENSFNINVHFDYSKRGLRVSRPNEESTPFEHISLEYGYVADANNEFTQTLPIINVHDMFKVEEKGFTIRLTNLEKQTTPYNGIEFSESDNIYRVVGTNRFVRLLILLSETTSFNDYVEYDTFVRDYERNPNENDEGITLFTEPEFTIIPKAVSNLYLDINVYEIYEIDIKSGLSETSFGTASELTKNSMPIAKLNGNLNNSVILPTVQGTNVQLLNAYHSQPVIEQETNYTKMLVEFGSHLRLTSSKDNVLNDIENERLIFEKWSISNEGKLFTNNNENLLESTPVRAPHTYTAEYRFKTVEIYISRDIIDADYQGGERSLPVPTLPNGTALDKMKLDTNIHTYVYQHNGRTIVSSMPSFTPKRFELPSYDINGNYLGEPSGIPNSFYTREITYGEEINFVVVDFSDFTEVPVFTGLRFGTYRFYTMPNNESMKVTQEGLTNNEFEYLTGKTDWFEFDPVSGRNTSFGGRVLDSFIIKSDYISKLNTFVNYKINDGVNRSGLNEVVHSNDQFLDEDVFVLENVSNFTSYNRSDTEIRFNLTEIANKEGLDINDISAQWYVQMPKNYIPFLDGELTSTQNIVGVFLDLEVSETKNNILFNTSLQEIDGEIYAVIKYKATVLDFVESYNSNGSVIVSGSWKARVNYSINIRLDINNID